MRTGYLLFFILFPSISFSAIKDKPNVVFILADDLGYGDLGCYGARDIATPNIDKLASDGILFRNFYAGTSVSAPSRCSLMTGLHTGHCPIRGNRDSLPYGQIPLPMDYPTIAEVFKNAGYTNALIGKWGLGVEGTEGDPFNHGFDYYFGYMCQILAHNHYPEYLIENGTRVYLDNSVKYVDKSHWSKGFGSYSYRKNTYSQDLFTSKAIDFINNNKDVPFFLYFPVVIPHDNGEAPSGKRYSDIPSNSHYSKMDWSEEEKGYASMISILDDHVGKIISELDKLSLLDNTIIIFSSDNGPDSPGRFRNISNFPYRGHKRDLYEGGIKVPFIISYPSRFRTGVISDHSAVLYDLMPTFCELLEVRCPDTDGLSFYPELIGNNQDAHDFLYFEFHEGKGLQALIMDGFKCIIKNLKQPDDLEVELYNLNSDPQESNDISLQNPLQVAKMRDVIDHEHEYNIFFNFNK